MTMSSDSWRIAKRSLRSSPLRAVLTALGIIIGVASVVTMVSIGNGARIKIDTQIESMGANVIMILPRGSRESGITQKDTSKTAVLQEDAAAITNEVVGVTAAAPSLRMPAQVIVGSRNLWTRVQGTSSAYFAVREWEIDAGRMFSAQEELHAEKVALLGRTVAEGLFGEAGDAIGKKIRVGHSHLLVIGTLAPKGPWGAIQDQDDVVIVPIGTMRQRIIGRANQINRNSVDYLIAKAASHDDVDLVIREITSLLRQRHGVIGSKPDPFTISEPTVGLDAQSESANTFTWLLATIASISLLVGGISIMNIMLVSVAERRREIGIRVAMGATRRHILFQFLIEALVLCVAGGVLGLMLGVGTALAISHFAQWPVFISMQMMFLAVLSAAGVGLFFGFYPAMRASSEDPISCLRAD
ncbi:ABC transporter permease [Sulfitobacter sp.]|uniref:ABC transporter permease n=1 Tax=Sulfitobacter sp. TaxID=1903071 RepID=UPI003002C58F